MPISDNDVLALLRQDMDKARAYQAELSAEREKLYRWYRAEPYGNERPGWSQTVHPTIFSVVEWMKPGFIEVFTGDFFAFNPIGKTDGSPAKKDEQQRADRLKRYVRHKLFNQLDGEQLVEDFIHDCLVNHYGVMKITQREDFDLTTELLPEMSTAELEDLAASDRTIVDIRGGKSFRKEDPLTGREVTGLRGAKAVRRRSKYQGFHLEVVPPRELYMLPGYPDLSRNPFVAHVVKRDLDSIRRQEMAGVYRKGSTAAVAARLDERRATAETAGEYATLHAVDGLSSPDGLGGPESLDSPARQGQGEVWVWECYTRLALDETKLLKPCIITVCEDQILRGPVENPYGGPPFELGYIYKEPHKAVGRPIAAVLDHRQRVLSNLLRNIQDSAAMSTYRGYLTTDARAKKILGSMSPGDVSLVPSLGTVQEVVPTPADPMLINAFQLTLQEAAKESGVNENMQGLDNDSLNKTAAGMQMRLSAGMQRQKLYARRIARSFRRILGRVLDIIRLYPPQDDLAAVGADVVIEPEDFMGEYTVSIDVGVGPQERMQNAQVMDEMIQIMLKAGLQLGICEPKGVIKAIKAKYGFMDIDVSEYLFSEERLDQVKELEGRIAQLQGHNQGLRQAIADHARELRGGPGGSGGPMPQTGAGGTPTGAGPMPFPGPRGPGGPGQASGVPYGPMGPGSAANGPAPAGASPRTRLMGPTGPGNPLGPGGGSVPGAPGGPGGPGDSGPGAQGGPL